MALFVDTYVEVETANLYLSTSSVWLGATTPEKTSALIAASQTFEPYRDWETDRKSTRLNSSHSGESRMPSSA